MGDTIGSEHVAMIVPWADMVSCPLHASPFPLAASAAVLCGAE